MQFRELLAERERGEALALFDDIRCAHRGPDAHEEMDVAGLYVQFEDGPALFVALLANQLVTPFANLMHQHLPAAFGAPDAVVDTQMDMLLDALVVQVAYVVAPVDILPQ